MRRGDLGLLAAALAMMVVAAMRVGSFWRGDYLPAAEPVATARPVASPAVAPTPSKAWVRPLFSRPNSAVEADPSSAVVTSSTTSDSQLPRLIGVIINQNDRVAILGYAGKVQRLQENGRIGNWTLSRIDPRSAMLKSATESRLLKLDTETQ
jgi:hypothetical protein